MTLLQGLRLSPHAPLQAAQERVFCDTCKSGLADVACHVIRCRSTQETRVQNACRRRGEHRTWQILHEYSTSQGAVKLKKRGFKTRADDMEMHAFWAALGAGPAAGSSATPASPPSPPCRPSTSRARSISSPTSRAGSGASASGWHRGTFLNSLHRFY